MNLIDPTLIYLKASFATTAKTYQSLPSEFIFFSSFTMVKPGFCAKISSQISDPQKTTVECLVLKFLRASRRIMKIDLVRSTNTY